MNNQISKRISIPSKPSSQLKARIFRYGKHPLRTLNAIFQTNGVRKVRTIWGDDFWGIWPEVKQIYLSGFMESDEERLFTDFFCSQITGKDIVFDVGANAGFYTLMAGHLAGMVYAFEPIPSTFDLLVRNVAGKDNIILANMALSNVTHPVSMEINEKDSGGNKISENGTVIVPATTLDAYCSATGVFPTIMKIDVEGSEGSVLAGGEATFRKLKPKLCIEIWPENGDAIFSLLKKYGYVLIRESGRNYIFQ